MNKWIGGWKNVQMDEGVGWQMDHSSGEWLGHSLGKVGMVKARRQALGSAYLLVL